MKIYIAGKITNNPCYKEQFAAAEEKLKNKGHQVINPAKNQGYNYKEYIDMGLFELMHCDAIYLLKGWEESCGANLEHAYAETVGMNILKENDCWDMPCSMGFQICCFDCEAAEGCPEACDNLKCRGDDDD